MNDEYTICWFDRENEDVTIVGIMVERKGRSDNDWTNEKRKVERLLERGLKNTVEKESIS